jgi:predicted mannosyl-3-phosphoglycerate phosphatase (HAD superfamily)
MKPFSDAPSSAFEDVGVVLTDMDDTLTFDGRLTAPTYAALERLEAAGVRVVPITAAPADAILAARTKHATRSARLATGRLSTRAKQA